MRSGLEPMTGQDGAGRRGAAQRYLQISRDLVKTRPTSEGRRGNLLFRKLQARLYAVENERLQNEERRRSG